MKNIPFPMKNSLILTFMVLLMCPFAAMAEKATQLVLTLTDNSTQTFLLQDTPKMTFGTSDLTIVSAATTYTVERAEVKNFTFAEVDPDGIHAIGSITYTGVSRIIDMQGRVVQEGNLNTNALPAGNYILQTSGQKAVKIMKK